MTDPIADLLARIRNAQTARHESLVVPHSILRERIVEILRGERFVRSHRVVEDPPGRKSIEIILRYTPGRAPLISMMFRGSRPGRRIYLGYREIRPVRNGMGIVILSTPQGILTDRQAREKKVGGELLCTIW